MRTGGIATWLSHRVHVSWHIAWLSFGVVIGIAAASYNVLAWEPAALYLIGATIVIIAAVHSNRWTLVLALLAGVCLGFARGDSYAQSLLPYEAYLDSRVQLSGRVLEDTTTGTDGDLRFRVTSIRIDGQQLPGEVWVSSKTVLDIKRGDQLEIEGMLVSGFGNVPATMHDAKIVQAERPLHGDVAREFRDWFADKVRMVIPEPEASLGIGYLVGQRSTLPQTLDNNLQLLGLTHIVVASGYNLTILVRFTRRLLARYSKYLALLSGLLLIVAFLMITGLSPSMSRAGLIAVISLLAWYFGRSVHPLVLLPFAAAFTALVNPAFVWGDLGWYLSFLAFAGIMIIAPLLTRYFWSGDKPISAPLQILIETLSAQLTTLPLILLVFGQYSPLALPANMLILPLVPLAMLCTFAAGLGASLFGSLAYIFGLPATAVLSYMTLVVDELAQLPWASGELVISGTVMIGMYGLLLAMTLYLWRKTRYDFRGENIVL